MWIREPAYSSKLKRANAISRPSGDHCTKLSCPSAPACWPSGSRQRPSAVRPNAATSCARPGPPLRQSESQSRGTDGTQARMLKALQIVVCGYCLLIISISASAQPAQRLSGVVRDTTASVLPGVTVTVTGAATVSPRTVTTDVQGQLRARRAARRSLPCDGDAASASTRKRSRLMSPGSQPWSTWCCRCRRCRKG